MAENLPHRTPATTTMQAVEWQSDLADRLRAAFRTENLQLLSYLEQPFVVLQDPELLSPLLRHLRDLEQFDMLTDLTATDRQPGEPRFEVIYILYSFAQNLHLRVKVHAVQVGTDPVVEYVMPSVVPLWLAADWMEREVFDMFGIHFAGHPQLTRILMPEGWKGFPLRKDYSITAADEDWVRENIEPCRTENN